MMVLILTSSLIRSPPACWSVLVRRLDGRGDGDLGRGRVGTDRPDKGLKLGIREELLELLGAGPLVDDDDEAVTDPEAVMDPARRAGQLGNLRELLGPVGKSLAKLGGIAR